MREPSVDGPPLGVLFPALTTPEPAPARTRGELLKVLPGPLWSLIAVGAASGYPSRSPINSRNTGPATGSLVAGGKSSLHRMLRLSCDLPARVPTVGDDRRCGPIGSGSLRARADLRRSAPCPPARPVSTLFAAGATIPGGSRSPSSSRPISARVSTPTAGRWRSPCRWPCAEGTALAGRPRPTGVPALPAGTPRPTSVPSSLCSWDGCSPRWRPHHRRQCCPAPSEVAGPPTRPLPSDAHGVRSCRGGYSLRAHADVGVVRARPPTGPAATLPSGPLNTVPQGIPFARRRGVSRTRVPTEPSRSAWFGPSLGRLHRSRMVAVMPTGRGTATCPSWRSRSRSD